MENNELKVLYFEGAGIEIYEEGSSIVLKKFEPNCIFCGNTKNLLSYHDKLICENCSKKIGNLKSEK